MIRPRTVGMVVTAAALLALLASLVAGLGADGQPDAAPADLPTRRERVRVEVLNAAGISGLARAATERLRDQGYDVVYYGNAPRSGPDSSVVLDRTGRSEAAREVALAAGIGRVRSEPDSSLYVDVSVVLGRDWSGIPAPPDSGAADSARPH